MTADDSNHKGGVVFTQEQQDAIAALASENKYAKQSKWKTLRELPPKDRWPFFRQNFLVETGLVLVVVAFVVALVVTMVTRGPDAELTVVRLNAGESYAQPMSELKTGFIERAGIEDERIAQFDGSYDITEDGNIYTDDSAGLLTRISAGDINVLITTEETLTLVETRGYASSLSEKLESSQLEAVADALVDVDGEPVTDASQAFALDLSKSATWTSLDGAPDDAYLVISNVEDETHLTRMRELVDYLFE
ncbi:hypothetical protein [Bifidobacterium eulemuris]|uniref:Uncharacterized protein n=1 Tax=Bifidobacterium eulemuris TaxID=1765219 RepID=A0A261G5M6_9BIFI|nr:hypothetical protein [Bifidobacterium eulemuris]OZG66505.1 hypothetical protein BEUL_1669 [Bifidobacterium eulemuris]QOL32601.1 hypothetical protein BE0216_09230 [Bifidobacterium eulemuris]